MLFLCVVNKKNWCAVNVVVGLALGAGVVSLNVTFNVVLTAFTVEGGACRGLLRASSARGCMIRVGYR